MPVDLGMLHPRGVELDGVDDLDEPSVHDPGILTGEHHPHEFLRLGEPTGLDDDDVDPGRGLSESIKIDIKLARINSAAQTPVPQRDGGVPSAPATAMASISMAPKSLTTAPIRLPPLRWRRWLRRVVLPEPRKPARTMTGICRGVGLGLG